VNDIVDRIMAMDVWIKMAVRIYEHVHTLVSDSFKVQVSLQLTPKPETSGFGTPILVHNDMLLDIAKRLE
jgi:hypothetical protein